VVDTTGVDKSLLGHAAFIETREGAADLCRVVREKHPENGRDQPADVPTNYWTLRRGGVADVCNDNGISAYK
jgi:hypothetical protein